MTTAARADRARTLATTNTTAAISNDQLFAWAQKTYPQFFGSAAPQKQTVAYLGKTFDVRYFASTGNYLGVANGEAFGLGPFTAQALQSFGAVQQYADQVCAGGGCGSTGTGTGGSLNECVDPSWASLPSGFNTRVVYTYSGIITGEQTVEAVVGGNETFEGQTARVITATTRGSNTVQGFTVPTTTVSKNYQQAGSNGLVKSLGSLIDLTQGGLTVAGFKLPDTTMQTKVVFDPPEENSEFALALGQSITKNSTTRSTTLASSVGVPAVGSTVTSSGSTTWTFEARESVTVPAGTYSSCRYRTSSAGGDSTVSWFIVGKGVMAKSEARSSAGTQTIQLKSGTYNGAAL